MLIPLASQESQLNASIVVLVFGVVVGIFGHVIRSRALILTGILIIGLFSAYFGFAAGHLN